MKEKKKPGRPSTYRKDVADAICAQLSEGTPLADICRADGMPAVRTVSLWKQDHPEFGADFARAREEGYDSIAADCLRIADASENDTVIVGEGDNEREAVNAEWISRSKLRVETRLKLLAKWDPKRYGEKMAIGGASDLPPLQTAAVLTDEQLMAIAATHAAKS